MVREAPDSMFTMQALNGTNGTLVDTEARDARRVELAVVLTTLVGIIQVGLPSPTLPLTRPSHKHSVRVQVKQVYPLEVVRLEIGSHHQDTVSIV